MAGLRLGYSLCADQELNIRLETVRQPWSVSGPAQRAGIAALKERDYLEATKRLIGPEREPDEGEACRAWLSGLSLQANYIFFRDPVWKEGDSLYDRLLLPGRADQKLRQLSRIRRLLLPDLRKDSGRK